jgi:hypothetical protein
MGQKGKFLVTNEGSFDLGTYTWDDQLFSDILIRENPIDTDQALGISQSLREDISRLEINTIPVSKPAESLRKRQTGIKKALFEKKPQGQDH